MYNSYDLTNRGVYPYNPASFPYVSWDVFSDEREHLHATDVIVDDTGYIIRIALAGYDKEKIKVKTLHNKVIVTASAGHDISRELKVIAREIPFDDFKRVYELRNIDCNGIKASFDKGILTINLPSLSQENNGDEREVDL